MKAYLAPQVANDAGENAMVIAITAVVEASVQANGGVELVTTGTLTEQGAAFVYSAGPNDRLVIDWAAGADTEIFVTTLDGYFEAETVEEFLSEPHDVNLRYVRSGEGDATVTSSENGADRSASISGDLVIDGQSYTVNLTKSGSYTYDHGGNGHSYESTETMAGTVTGPDFSLVAVEEFWAFTSVFGQVVTNRIREGSTAFTAGGTDYVFDGLYIKEQTIDGFADDTTGYWDVSGDVLVGGAPVGSLALSVNDVTSDVVFVSNNGDQTVLESTNNPQD